MESTKEILSKNLKMELELRKISQKKLALALGVKQQTVSEWVKGECLPSLDTFRKICIVLKAEPEILLDLDIETEIPFSAYEIIRPNPKTGGGLIFDFVELRGECNGAFCQSAPLHQGGMVLTSLF